MREPIRRDQDRLKLRQLMLDGAASEPAAPVDDAYFAGLREQVRAAASQAAKPRKPA